MINHWLLIVTLLVFYHQITICKPIITSNELMRMREDKKLVLILLDGFRWDQTDKCGLEGFQQLKREGVKAKHITPVFPSLTINNMYTIVTGLHPEDHGFVTNCFYNETTGEDMSVLNFNITAFSIPEPLWITTTLAGLTTACYQWIGCSTPYNGITPAYTDEHILDLWTVKFRNSLDDTLSKMVNDQLSVSLVYSPSPDMLEHFYGPDSIMVDAVIYKIDDILKEFLENVTKSDMEDKLNVVVMSDHGFTQLTDTTKFKVVYLSAYLNTENIVKIVHCTTTVVLYPKPGKLEQVYREAKTVPGINVWKKEDIPERYHIKNNVRTGPILMSAKKGITIIPHWNNSIQVPNQLDIFFFFQVLSGGNHGYDSEEEPDMNGIFLAKGPDFKRNLEVDPIKMVDVYNILMTAIGLTPLPNRGNWQSVVGMLNRPPIRHNEPKTRLNPFGR